MWYFTQKDGTVAKAYPHEISAHAVLQRLSKLHIYDPKSNPFAYIAIARYSTGSVYLLRRTELEQLVRYI